MRVLFYVEPHPIRNSKVHFKDIARAFLPLLSSSSRLDVRLFANSDTLEALKDALSPHKGRIIPPLDADEAIFDSYDLPWTTEGIPVWLDLMEGKGTISKDYQDVLGRIWQRFPFNVIVHWGEKWRSYEVY